MSVIPTTHPQIRVQFPNGMAAIANRLMRLKDSENFAVVAEAARDVTLAARDVTLGAESDALASANAAATSETNAAQSANSVLNQQFLEITANYTLTAASLDKYIKCQSVTDINITVPNDATENLPYGRAVILRRRTVAQVLIQPEAGVTVNGTLAVPEQHSSLVLIKVGPNEWDVS